MSNGKYFLLMNETNFEQMLRSKLNNFNVILCVALYSDQRGHRRCHKVGRLWHSKQARVHRSRRQVPPLTSVVAHYSTSALKLLLKSSRWASERTNVFILCANVFANSLACFVSSNNVFHCGTLHDRSPRALANVHVH